MNDNICDIHSHILPGIDDGSKNWDMTLQMVQQSWDAGVRTMFATPHYLPWRSRLKPETVKSLVEEAREKIRSELGIKMELWPGEELYYHNEIIADLEHGIALPLAGSRYVLVEFSEDMPYQEIRMAVEKFRRSPWKLIIAHVERYQALRKGDNLDEVLSMGAVLQSNAEEMQRGLFDSTKRWLKKRYDAQEIRYIGSDAHDLSRRPPLSEASLRWFHQHLDEEYKQEILYKNGKSILNPK